MTQIHRSRLVAIAATVLATAGAGGVAPPLIHASPPSVDGAAPPPLLDVALDAAKWIRASGVRTSNGLVWPADPRDPATIGTTLYAGTPGVVLFLLEAHRATGRAEFLNDAKRGADHLLTTIEATQATGLYEGLAGIGFTLGEVYKATKDPTYRAGLERVVTRLGTLAHGAGRGEGVEWSNVTDIISGSAGTGLFLLYAAKTLPSEAALSLARRAGTRLAELGKPAEGGLMWEISPGFPRNYPNFSHGTAGVSYFLATLSKDTDNHTFLDAALGGARYLKAIADTDGDVCLIFHHEPGDDGRHLFYLGWCHGPAGTARLWYQLYKVTGDRDWLGWADKSARGILRSGIPEQQTPGFWNNVSACCGSASVASFFLAMHQVTGNAEYLAFSRKITASLIAKATRDEAGTRWIQAENRIQPDNLVAQTGWMQGASGIGAWLLRLDAFDRKRPIAITLPDDPF
jgi:lantibiotic modifying enzyme